VSWWNWSNPLRDGIPADGRPGPIRAYPVLVLIDSAIESRYGAPAGFRHDAFVYTDDRDFVRRSAPYVRTGIDAGEAVLVAVPQTRIALLREELGDAAEQVAFVDMTEVGRNPARIIPLWRDLLDENPGRPVRGLGEPVYVGRSPAEIEEARLHEALLNLVFEHAGPFRLRCPYQAAVVSPRVGIGASHPRAHGSNRPAHHGRTWKALVEQGFREPLSVVPEAAERRGFEVGELTDLRLWVEGRARSYGLAEDRNDDLALALHEVCTNSVRFGGGRGTLSLWREGGSLICDVADSGHITDLLVGRVLPPAHLKGGRGVWLANQLCDLVQIRSTPGGTQIRLHTTLPY
jgi:anti-sigma regulatory factor (Ser/Thr protein kinase)